MAKRKYRVIHPRILNGILRNKNAIYLTQKEATELLYYSQKGFESEYYRWFMKRSIAEPKLKRLRIFFASLTKRIRERMKITTKECPMTEHEILQNILRIEAVLEKSHKFFSIEAKKRKKYQIEVDRKFSCEMEEIRPEPDLPF